jgi:nucleoside-diphosphate-sugar epimerase
MKVFVTGATGLIGSAFVPELIKAGHHVLGLTRSDAGAESLKAAGADVHQGSLEDLDSLRSGAGKSEGVIHCAFNNDFSKFKESNEQEGRAIDALGSVPAGSDRPLVITSVAAMGSASPGQLATEDYFDPSQQKPRSPTENAAAAAADRGVIVSLVRLPQVHNIMKQDIVTRLIQIARAKGVSAYMGEGLNRWAAGHVLDVAHLYRLVVEKHEVVLKKPEAVSRYHAVAEEGVPLRLVAETIGRGLNVPVVSLSPEEAPSHFGPLAMFVGADMSASSQQTESPGTHRGSRADAVFLSCTGFLLCWHADPETLRSGT